jgi:putative ABC transport system permease protein
MFRTALRFLVYDKAKSLGALFGVILSVFLIGQQCGIFIFLTNAMSALVRNNSDYIWVVDDKTTDVNSLATLDMRKARELASVPGVSQVSPLVLASGGARFANGKNAGVILIGVQYPECAGGPWFLDAGRKEDLLKEGAIITDVFDKEALGSIKIGDYFEVNGKKVFLAGQTRGVRSFGGTYTFTTIERARYLGNLSNNQASAFLLKWDPQVPREQVIARINQNLQGVRAWSSEDFTRQTILTVLSSSGIALSFGTLIVFALIVGFVIIGLTLYSAAIDRLRDYGTLKAIGATNGYISRLILMQAMILAVIGFLIGYTFVNGFKTGVAQAGTIFEFPLWLRFGFLLLTLFIALFGSLFAIRRITGLEPSAIFRT